jgi:hypothetical protein
MKSFTFYAGIVGGTASLFDKAEPRPELAISKQALQTHPAELHR